MEKHEPQVSRQEVIKHSAAIQITNNITLLQRRVWNVLLHHAYNELPTHEKHHITVKKLLEILRFSSRNDYFKESIKALVGCTVEWNFLDKDGEEEWGASALLASVRIKGEICEYTFSPHLRERLHNPRMYARLDLSLQNQFDSKHALALWELCVDYLGAGREYGETPFIPLEQFRKLMGIADGAYSLYKLFSQWVLKPAVAEINRVSDLKVTVDYQRQGRKIVALKFKIRRMLRLPESSQPDLFFDLDDMPAVAKLLTDAGLAMHDALEIWQKGFDMVEPGKHPSAGDKPEEAFVQYVKEKIHLMHQRRVSGKLTNPTGFLLSAIQKNYSNARMEQEAKGRARKVQAQELTRLLAQQQQVTREMEDALHALADQIIETLPELLEEAIAALQAENNLLIGRYDARQTPLHNYRKHPAVAIGVGHWLEKRFPERFEKARHAFAKQLASIEARLSELKGHKAAAG
jgi:hypothetical protein